MKIVATKKSEQNQAILDPWSIVHFATGLGAAIAYEFVEQGVERQEVGQELFESSGPESVGNAIADVVLFAAGHALGRLWNSTGGD